MYQMTKTLFNNLLKARKGTELKMNPYKYVCNIVNEQFGIKGKITKITIKE